MQDVLRLLAVQNGFEYRPYPIYDKRALTSKEQRLWIEKVAQVNQNLQRPLATDRHLFFVDMESYGTEPVNWINIVRDPIERLISRFYYLRNPRRWKNRSPKPPQVCFLSKRFYLLVFGLFINQKVDKFYP